MEKRNGAQHGPPSYSAHEPPPHMPPSYTQAMAGTAPMALYTPPEPIRNGPPIMTRVVPLGPERTRMVCPYCEADIDTNVHIQPKRIAYVSCVLLALIGCVFCCCLPFCMTDCMSIKHTCPNCGRTLGKYNE